MVILMFTSGEMLADDFYLMVYHDEDGLIDVDRGQSCSTAVTGVFNNGE